MKKSMLIFVLVLFEALESTGVFGLEHSETKSFLN